MINAMKSQRMLWVFCILLDIFSTEAIAQDAVTEDVRCAVVGIKISTMTGTAPQKSGVLLATYYFGRLDGQGLSAREIERRILAEANRMTDVDFVAEVQRCGAVLAEKGDQITQIEKALVSGAKAVIPPRK